MKIFIFALIFLIVFFLLPDGWIGKLVADHVHISGDGEVAMDNFELTVIAIRAMISAAISALLIRLYVKVRMRKV